MPKSGKERAANRKVRKTLEGKRPATKTVADMLHEQLTGVVEGVDKNASPVLKTNEPQEQTSDIALVETAVKRRWPIRDDRKGPLVNRLFEIVDKKTTIVNTKLGPMEVDADHNSIAAARVIVAMEGQNQEEEKEDRKDARSKTSVGTAVQVNVGIGNGSSNGTDGNSSSPGINLELETIKAAVNDPAYIEFKRQCALRSDSQPSVNDALGKSRAMESSRTSNGNGPSSNGFNPGTVNGKGYT